MIRENRINIASDDRSDAISRRAADSAMNKEAKHRRDEEFRRLVKEGMNITAIAKLMGADRATVRRAVGPTGRSTPAKPIKFQGRVYGSIKEMRLELRMSWKRVQDLLSIGRARYVR